jgi:hypothetical protein
MPEPDLRDRPAPEPIKFRRPYAAPPVETTPDEVTPGLPSPPSLPSLNVPPGPDAVTGVEVRPVEVTTVRVEPASLPPPAFISPPSGPPRSASNPPRRRSDGPLISTFRALQAQFRWQWQQWTARAETSANKVRRNLSTEVNQDVDYVTIRARHYHERQPLQALGMVAASAFAVGMIFGFWRR